MNNSSSNDATPKSSMGFGSFEVSSCSNDHNFDASNDEFDHFIIPLPRSVTNFNHQERPQSNAASDTTPLILSRKPVQKQQPTKSSTIIFGSNTLGWQKHLQSSRARHHQKVSTSGIIGFLFGFMMEETIQDDNGDVIHSVQLETHDRLSRKLLAGLCMGFLWTSSAAATAGTLVPFIAESLLAQDSVTHHSPAMSSFTSKATASSVLGLAMGKFINGPMPDIVGARHVSITYAVLLTITLVFLSISWSETCTLWACFFVDFFQTVQWPAIIIVLASHSKGTTFENGLFMASLSSRLASLLSIPVTLFMLHYFNWRAVALWASGLSFFGGAIIFTLVRDSPTSWNSPQNPISESVRQEYKSALITMQNHPIPPLKLLWTLVRIVARVIQENVGPSMRQVLTSSIFWVVAVAHAGDAIVGTSQRMIGMYYYDSSGGLLTSREASGLAVVLSIGTILGLAIAGNIFKSSSPRGRQRLIARLYSMSICSCYLLAALSLPIIQHAIGDSGLVLAFQLIGAMFMGFGCAVQSMIPGILGGSFGQNKGLYSAYTDGIAFALSSFVWRIVGCSVHGGDSLGWAYGWGAVALLIIICALMMVEFFGHFFVRRQDRKQPTNYETIIFV